MNTRPRSLAAWLLPLLALAASGCGLFSGPRPAEPMPDPATGVTLVLYHVHLGEPAEGYTDHVVYLDGASVGRVNEGEELRLHVAPGVRELRIQPEARWLGGAQQAPLKYSLQLAKGSTRYLRYRTATAAGRLTAPAGTVYLDRELDAVGEQDYGAKR
ncbi:MAG: hypothetical protein U1F53_11055 [Burkholderiaceae bacterium]